MSIPSRLRGGVEIQWLQLVLMMVDCRSSWGVSEIDNIVQNFLTHTVTTRGACELKSKDCSIDELEFVTLHAGV